MGAALEEVHGNAGPVAVDDSAAVQYVRQHLTEHELQQTDDESIHRFLRATNGHQAQAVKRLQATLHWRERHRPETVVCTACAATPRSHYMHLIGHDKQRRPIIYSCHAMATCRSVEANKAHMIQTFEMAVRCMPPGVDQWVWVCDFHGFGTRDINPRLAKLFLDMSADHYPERLAKFYLVDAPKLFNVLWKAIYSLIDEKTTKKINFLPFDVTNPKSVLRDTFLSHCDEQTTEWLLREMVQNRDKKVMAQKVYNMADIYSEIVVASKSQLKGGDAAVLIASSTNVTPAGDVAGAHDVRGSPSIIEHYMRRPSLLLPQATAVV